MHADLENNFVELTLFAYCSHCKTVDKKERYIRRFKDVEHCLTWIMTYSMKDVANMVMELENAVTSEIMYSTFFNTDYATFMNKRKAGQDQKFKYVKVQKFATGDKSSLLLWAAKKNFPYYPNFLI